VIIVKVFNNNIEQALRIFKRKVKSDGILELVQERQYYSKPSLKKRAKSNKARHRNDY